MPRERYEDIPWLMQETDALYQRIVERAPEKTKVALTRAQVIKLRGWEPSLPLTQRNFDAVLDELKVFYVPRVMQPGPVVVFPMRDIDGVYRYAQSKFLDGSVIQQRATYKNPGAKYYRMGLPMVGPQWLGNSPEAIARIVKSGRAFVVEGPFDLLACRLLCPELPVLSPLTKSLGKDHQAYLRMLGIRDLFLLYDNEPSGKGQAAMEWQAKEIKTMRVTKLFTCASDPSDALQDRYHAEELRRQLLFHVRAGSTNSTKLD
jgi:hypothetical protein